MQPLGVGEQVLSWHVQDGSLREGGGRGREGIVREGEERGKRRRKRGW
jgi:hypothetical protein